MITLAPLVLMFATPVGGELPIVFVSSNTTVAPDLLYESRTLQLVDQGAKELTVGTRVYPVVREDDVVLIVDPKVNGVKQILELTGLAVALKGAKDEGLVSDLGKEAQSILAQKLALNAPYAIKAGDELPSGLRYDTHFSADIRLQLDGKTVRSSVGPPRQGEPVSSTNKAAFDASALKYRKDFRQPANGPTIGEGDTVAVGFTAVRQPQWNPGAFAMECEKATRAFSKYIIQLETSYRDALLEAVGDKQTLLDDILPRHGLSDPKLSDLSPSSAEAVRQSILRRYSEFGFKDQNEAERFLALASVSLSPNLSIGIPVEQENGSVMTLGYGLTQPPPRK